MDLAYFCRIYWFYVEALIICEPNAVGLRHFIIVSKFSNFIIVFSIIYQKRNIRIFHYIFCGSFSISELLIVLLPLLYYLFRCLTVLPHERINAAFNFRFECMISWLSILIKGHIRLNWDSSRSFVFFNDLFIFQKLLIDLNYDKYLLIRTDWNIMSLS